MQSVAVTSVAVRVLFNCFRLEELMITVIVRGSTSIKQFFIKPRRFRGRRP